MDEDLARGCDRVVDPDIVEIVVFLKASPGIADMWRRLKMAIKKKITEGQS